MFKKNMFVSSAMTHSTVNIFVQGISVVLPIENQMTKPQVLNDKDNDGDVGDDDGHDGRDDAANRIPDNHVPKLLNPR